MRVLFATLPYIGHLYPLIPIAWAARAAGHEVLVATFGEGKDATRAGLPVVDIAPDRTGRSLFVDFVAGHPDLVARMEAGDDSEYMEGARFGIWGEWLADSAVAHARSWRPDVVVHERMAPFGRLVAGALGVPCVRHDLGIEPGALAGQLRHMAPALARHGVPGLVDDSPWIDIVPPSLAPADRDGWPMRPVPYNGGAVLPDWLVAPTDRPRVAVTVGTLVGKLQGMGVVERIIALARKVDAEFVLAVDSHDRAKLGDLPPNVRGGHWLPLSSLLPTCAAVVHHGGSGTMCAAIDAGIPQLLLPNEGATDRPINAAAVVTRGIGLACSPDDVDAGVVRHLIGDHRLRVAAAEVRAEMAAMPSPAALIRRVEALVG
ncbi:nucleotide disphospho-sugar-binding domain-containing protein [Umezawaea tangerina]|uniref:UDP:flavonoid glycosyltransferase YjiC (YdhE family) n=1 Tax=Umezawaea tangerina TaxID=84725 RepID=A0A2T0SN15_9PSEU|nr:nucleotide disphospho-sugar-binding domain-containing protein [Umezawaea tangerina]PRY34786.1 UDP:flavonoid glycosyltransferase YjiC (YdhE family) [Umezawaea tangerina]